MLPAGFEPAIPASELPQTHDLDRSATSYLRSLIFSTKRTEDDNTVSALNSIIKHNQAYHMKNLLIVFFASISKERRIFSRIHTN
jgi:hypothetical protein